MKMNHMQTFVLHGISTAGVLFLTDEYLNKPMKHDINSAEQISTVLKCLICCDQNVLSFPLRFSLGEGGAESRPVEGDPQGSGVQTEVSELWCELDNMFVLMEAISLAVLCSAVSS